MRSSKLIHVVSCHAEGEVGDVVVGGVNPPHGDTILDQSLALAQDRTLHDFLLNEPRGGVFRHVNVLVPAKNDRADVGCIIMEPETFPLMSGSNTMCVATVLLETGMITMQEPLTTLAIEMPGGVIEVRAACRNGKVDQVSFLNMPSFVDRLDVPIDVAGLGSLKCDIAFGGDSFVIVDAGQLGFALQSDEAADLAAMGMRILAAAKEQLGFQHPVLPALDDITFCLLAGLVNTDGHQREAHHAVTIKPGKLDRSPTGTGCSARLAVMHARGQAGVGDTVSFRSIMGGRFAASIAKQTTIAGRTAIIPQIAGRAWITGVHQHMLDPQDPWPTGYKLSDTWPHLK